jgi:hypothetical protein
MTEDTSADDGRDYAAGAVEEGAAGGDSAGAEWDPNEPVPRELRDGADDGIDDALRETVADDLADIEDDEPDYPSGDDPVEPQDVDTENAAFVVLGVVVMFALVAVLLLSI